MISLAFTKVAILCIYPHLSPSKPFRICVWALAGLVVCSSVVSLIWSICSCLPVQDSWSLAALVTGKCPLNTNFIIYTGAMNVATDVAILVLPMIMLRHVAISKKKKIGVILMLATGSLYVFNGLPSSTVVLTSVLLGRLLLASFGLSFLCETSPCWMGLGRMSLSFRGRMYMVPYVLLHLYLSIMFGRNLF